MNRENYLNELSKYINRLPKDDYEDAMSYFQELFDEAGAEGTESLIKDLGEPRMVANELLVNLLNEGSIILDEEKIKTYSDDFGIIKNEKINNDPKFLKNNNEANNTLNAYKSNSAGEKNSNISGFKTVLIAILIVFAAPIGLPLAIALIAIIFSFVVVLLSLAFSAVVLAISGILVFGKILFIGIASFGTSFSGALVLVGSGFIVIALSILLFLLTIYFCKFIIYILKKFFTFVSRKVSGK